MEITDNKVSEFHSVLLDKNKVLESEEKKMLQTSQSPHIDEDLAAKGTESNIDDVNKDSDSILDNQGNKDSTSISTGNNINAPQQTLACKENIIKSDIPASSSISLEHLGDQSSQTENKDLELIVHKSEAALELNEETGLEKQNVSTLSQIHKSCETTESHPDTVQNDNMEIKTLIPDVSQPSQLELIPATSKTQPSQAISSANLSPSKEINLVTVQSDCPIVSVEGSIASVPEVASHVSPPSASHLTPATPKTQTSSPTLPPSPKMNEEHSRLQEQLKNYESQIDQLKKALSQKDNTITLYQRENILLEKEKSAFRKEKELATKEKESIVITFATKEKSLIDAKKQKELIEKQLADSRKEVKNISTKFHALNEEKSRITYMLDEKCNEIKKFQKELDKQKAEFNSLEMKLKWNMVKLAQETEAKLAAEKKLEEERNAPKPAEEKANEKLKVEYEATTILLKHELEKKDKAIESLTKEHKQATEKINQLQDSISKEILENTSMSRELECIRQEHAVVQNSYSEEMLNSAKLRGQLEELQVLRTQHTINEDKISTLTANLRELEDKVQDSAQDLDQLYIKERELLSINKEMSEMIVGLQNQICLQSSKVKGVEAENEILKKEKLDFDTKYNEIELQLKQEVQQKNDERLLLTKHLSEKTKLYESVKVKLDNAQGDLEATKKKHSQVVKELQRELQKFKKSSEANTSPSLPTTQDYCKNCQLKSTSQEQIASRGSSHSRSDSESEAQSTTSTMNRDIQGPSKQHLVERILRLQQASARQTEKIDFLENHTLSLVAELQKKSKVVQYYMMRDQAGALTSSKSDQNKSELAKYGGVMSAIYSGIKGPNQSMTLELSLEINKKLQAVLEDTLLKNITLKENLDVLGLEVDKLTRKIAQIKS